jgi:glyoxylase-like metal-dependent hydrolase (beta-lactamase superfamily II)
MKLSCFTGGFVQTNGYLLETVDGNVLVDAPEGVADWLVERGVRVDEVLLTHQHYDHVMDVAALRATGARVRAFAGYSRELTLETLARGWGMPISVVPYEVDVLLEVDAPLRVAGMEFELAHVPGHSTDSVTFYLAAAGLVFSGDTLFAGSIGRCDLPGGSMEQLLDGIGAHLLGLPDGTRVLPGHGGESTIGREKRENPYLG